MWTVLPSGAETSADIPFSLQNYLCTSMDQTKDQVKAILGAIKPKFVLYDFAYWVASFSQELGFKSISYSIVSAALQALRVVPSRKMIKGMTFEEMMQTPPGYPSSKVVPRPDEAAEAEVFCLQFGSGLSFYERLVKSKKESDAFAIRTCYEIEGPFIDYLAQQYAKPVLLTGPVLPEKRVSQLDQKWDKWLSKFEEGSGDCQIVLIPAHGDHIVTTMIMVEEMEVAVEVKREENGWISKESLCNAMESVMSRDSEVAITSLKQKGNALDKQEQLFQAESVKRWSNCPGEDAVSRSTNSGKLKHFKSRNQYHPFDSFEMYRFWSLISANGA
ncbi:hypothetical protein GH714_010162 [Hevea brasiliensis]|uniref:Anthocyanidin 3-O-glucosyltransferase n=1 Tax=Hevea brasiliensis TaxID=3981 RepID=A0A6A6KB50_HEVBR|nr:hypothetical protein GH714_010162 [Hevea brasiliensis]